MTTEHRLMVVGRCPVDGTDDVYDVRVTVYGRVLPVEEILASVRANTAEPVFQEALTERLAHDLRAHVRTVGHHSGVETTCEEDGS